MGITSYAQNFEDVILWRALGAIGNGVYMDVGAQHPITDSVSRAFYEKGWRGIHVEPVPSFAELLRRDRPDEIVIEAALASEPGTSRFFEVVGTGLSTADPQIAQHHREQGWPVREITVPTLTLDDIFGLAQDGLIHWLKIDVEGFEREVLLGWRTSTRPWIVVIESTFPNSQVETHEKWENLLLQKGYAPVYRDGLNRYYLSPDHIELAAAFQFGPNFFDGFQIAESNSAVAEIRHRFESFKQTFHEQARSREAELHAQAEARLESLRRETQAEVQRLQNELESRQQALLESERRFAERLAELHAQTLQSQREAAQSFAAREAQIREELAAVRLALESARAEADARERQLHSDFERQLQEFHEQARSREAELHAQAEARLEAAQLRWKAEEDALNVKLTQYAAQTQALAQHIQAMQSTLWWRLSVPFRRRSRWRLTDVSNAIRNSTHGDL